MMQISNINIQTISSTSWSTMMICAWRWAILWKNYKKISFHPFWILELAKNFHSSVLKEASDSLLHEYLFFVELLDKYHPIYKRDPIKFFYNQPILNWYMLCNIILDNIISMTHMLLFRLKMMLLVDKTSHRQFTYSYIGNNSSFFCAMLVQMRIVWILLWTNCWLRKLSYGFFESSWW